MFRSKKGSGAAVAITLLFSLIILIAMAVVFLTQTPFLEKVWDKTINQFTDSNNIETAQKIKSAWYKWPLLVIICVFLMGIIAVIKKANNNTYGYYG